MIGRSRETSSILLRAAEIQVIIQDFDLRKESKRGAAKYLWSFVKFIHFSEINITS